MTRKEHFSNCQGSILQKKMINLLAMVANWRSRRKQTKQVCGKPQHYLINCDQGFCILVNILLTLRIARPRVTLANIVKSLKKFTGSKFNIL